MMLVELGLAIGVSLVGMMVVGAIVRQLLGLRSAINWLCQTAVLFGAATVLSVGAIPTMIMLLFPTVIHIARLILVNMVTYRAANGHYGEAARWAYELMEEDEDEQFIHAQSVLPRAEVMEVRVVADSKQEMRDLMIERYNELVSEELSANADNFKL